MSVDSPCTDPPNRLRRQFGLAAWAAAAATLLPAWARAGHELRPWPPGKAAPALELASLDGTVWSLNAQRGKAVALNFWATWCEPCRAEMPSLQALAQRHAGDGLVVLAVNHGESERTVRRFVNATHMALPVLLDPARGAALAWTTGIFPSTVLIDRSGRPRHLVVGELDWTGDDAARLILPLLATS